jgi:hypothetical protein
MWVSRPDFCSRFACSRSVAKRAADKEQSATKEQNWQSQKREKYRPAKTHDKRVVQKQKKQSSG